MQINTRLHSKWLRPEAQTPQKLRTDTRFNTTGQNPVSAVFTPAGSWQKPITGIHTRANSSKVRPLFSQSFQFIQQAFAELLDSTTAEWIPLHYFHSEAPTVHSIHAPCLNPSSECEKGGRFTGSNSWKRNLNLCAETLRPIDFQPPIANQHTDDHLRSFSVQPDHSRSNTTLAP